MEGIAIDSGVKALFKVAQLLDAFSVEKPEMTLSELASACGLRPPTARRLLLTCEAVGFIAQDPNSRRYRLGMKLFELGHRVGEQLQLRRVARPYLRQIVEGTQETAYLSVLAESEVLYVERVDSPNPVRLTSFVGQRLALHSTGTGKVLMAYLHPEHLEVLLARPLRRFTPATICDPEALRQELKRVREQGFATTLNEHLDGAFSVAAPVFGAGGKVIAGVGISGPSYRVSEVQMEEFAGVVTGVARRFSLDMGARVIDIPESTEVHR